jgi:spore coat protein U-like protein
MTGATLTLSAGTSNTFNARQMIKGTDRLDYNLYTNAARTIVWGDGTAGTGTVAALTIQSNGRFLNHNRSRNFAIPAYGRIPANQDAVPGAYSDTITVTMSY